MLILIPYNSLNGVKQSSTSLDRMRVVTLTVNKIFTSPSLSSGDSTNKPVRLVRVVDRGINTNIFQNLLQGNRIA